MPTIADSMRVVKVQATRKNPPQYRITLPKDIVDKYEIRAGLEFLILDEDGIIKLIPKEKVRIEVV